MNETNYQIILRAYFKATAGLYVLYSYNIAVDTSLRWRVVLGVYCEILQRITDGPNNITLGRK